MAENKTAPEALREAVEEALRIDAVTAMDIGIVLMRIKVLRAAHERPGAYGPHPDDLPNTARELLQWVFDTVGLSAENEAIFATKLGSLVASECVSASREVAKERDDLRAQLEVARSAETAQEAAREALAEAGVERETVAEGIRGLAKDVEELNRCRNEAVDRADYLMEVLWMACDATGTRRDAVSARQIPVYVEGLRERARKAEAAGGVGLLRRLRADAGAFFDGDAVRTLDAAGTAYNQACHNHRVWLGAAIDRLIAEAEAQPAEEPERGPHVHYTVEPGKREAPAEKVVTVHGGDGVRVVLGDEPKREPQDGDDVLRAFLDDRSYVPSPLVDAARELVRRALR